MADCLQILKQLLLALIVICPTLSLPSYDFRQGADATVLFQHTLRTDGSSFSCELFTINSELPFYTNGNLQPDNLEKDQRERFAVDVSKRGRTVDIILKLEDMQEKDGGVYILSLREITDRIVRTHIYDAFLNVFVPPPTATCEVHPLHPWVW